MKKIFVFYPLLFIVCLLCSCKPPKNPNSGVAQPTTSQDVPVEQDSTPVKTNTTNPNVNLYVENSGSMFGYLYGGEFKDTLNWLMADLVSSKYTTKAKCNLYYINSKPYQINEDIVDFINNMQRTANQYGATSATDIALIFDTIMARTNDTTLSILVSDLILSPGKEDASSYLTAMSIKINNLLSSVKSDFAIEIFHCNAKFNGTYYNCVDQKKNINCSRPYYICVIGKTDLVKDFWEKQSSFSHFRSTNSWVYFDCNPNAVNYCVMRNPNCKYVNPNTITDARRDKHTNMFRFEIGVDFNKYILDDAYICDVNNYVLNNPNYKIERVYPSVVPMAQGSSTHKISISTTQNVTQTTLKIAMKKTNIPQWAIDLNNSDCDSVFVNLDKTFGLYNIFDGISSAYKTSDNNFLKINININ